MSQNCYLNAVQGSKEIRVEKCLFGPLPVGRTTMNSESLVHSANAVLSQEEAEAQGGPSACSGPQACVSSWDLRPLQPMLHPTPAMSLLGLKLCG